MNDDLPQTPAEAARAIWENDRQIDRVTAELRAQRRRLPGLVRARRLAYARAFLSTQGTSDFRKQSAEVAFAEAAFEKDVCDQEIEGCREELWNLRGRSEDLRAINSNLKEELRSLGSLP